MQQAQHFRDECEALHEQIASLSADDLARSTAFKGWAIDDVLRHLHTWNRAAALSLAGGEAFREFFASVGPYIAERRMRDFERDWLAGLSGPPLVTAWRDFSRELAQRFSQVDPSLRVEWAGPSMSARSSISARLMETWAHGQAVYDLLGVRRQCADRIRNVVVLGVNTYRWSFEVRGLSAPAPLPHLRLYAPSGALWSYGEPSDVEVIEGQAEEFCQVVTQTRNVADTELRISGANARAWMEHAQCFAGPAEQPPAPGSRRTASPDR